MLKKLFVILILLLGGIVFAEETPTFTPEFVQQIKTAVFSKDCVYKLETPEFKKIIQDHKKDTNYLENYYAAQSGYTYFKNNNLSAMFTPKMDVMYMYSLQETNNLRIIYYYNIWGRLQNIDFLYDNYPSYPYFSRKYNSRGKLLNTTFYSDEMTKIKFNNDGSKYEIYYKGKLFLKN